LLAPDMLRRTGRALAARTLQRMGTPSRGRVFYNSFNGQFSDSPRAIYEELLRRGREMQHAWIADSGTFPSDVTTVAPYSVGYLREVARAGYVVANQQLPNNFRKRPGATYLQTWHGTPLKRIGFDNDRWKRNPRGFDHMARDFAKWDFLISQNPFSSEIFRRAFRFEGEILETGYPRNDVLNSADATAIRTRVRDRLGIEDGMRAILYAPTWRDNVVDERGALRFSLALDVPRLEAALGEDHRLLLRLHYLLGSATPEGELGDFTLNVSAHPDIRDLYLAADVLVTDYSSAMFDFAVTGKPIVFFPYDIDEYRDSVRGFYFDLEAEAPGPVCQTTHGVIEALRDLDAVHAAHAARYVRFRERFCPFDDGAAAARVIDRVMGDS
jgi:CDP-glycerol glycerophosphotransferase